MPTYVYGCKDKEHPQKEIVHKMSEDPDIRCTVCKKKMHRIPQAMRFYLSPFDILGEWSTVNHGIWKARKRGKRVKQFSPDHINKPDGGLSGKDFDTRSYKKDVR